MSEQDGTTTTNPTATSTANAATAQQAAEAAASAAQAAQNLGDAGKAAIERMKSERDAERVARATALTELETTRTSSQREIASRETRIAELQTELQTKASLADRYEIALDKGLPKALAARLQGSTVEELSADADALKALLGASTIAAELLPDPSQGARGGGTADPAQQFAEIIRNARSRGN